MGDEPNFEDIQVPTAAGASSPTPTLAPPAAERDKAEKPPPPAPQAGNADHWHVIISDREVGPISLADLKTAIREGKVKPTDKVRKEPAEEWQEVSQVSELAESIAELAAKLAERQKKKVVRARPRPPVLTEALRQIAVKDDEKAAEARKKGENVAHIPSTILTVEYVDSSEGMEAALKALDQRLTRLEDLTQSLEEITSRLVSAIAKQTKDINQSVESLNRRVDRIYMEVQQGGGAKPAASAPASAQEVSEEQVQFPDQFKADADHQRAWQIAQVIMNDLEAYYGDDVREGVMYGNLLELLQGPIGEGRKTYEERASERARQEFDYFDLALKQLIVRKKKELAQEERPA